MPKSLGEKLVAERIKRRLSQREVAELLGVTRNSVSGWERGLYAPDDLSGALVQAFLEGKDPVAKASDAQLEASYAAGVLWSIAQDAEHIAQKARDAHNRLRGGVSVQRGTEELEARKTSRRGKQTKAQ